MIQLNRFPDGKRRAVTFSYDDGSENDVRLIELFNRYGVKGTFHLNGVNYIGKTDDELLTIRKRYEGHEISCHTLRHGELNRMTSVSMIREVMEDRKILERIAGYPVVGMSYPNGRWDARVTDVLRACGIVYSRTAKSTGAAIEFPDDMLEWHPSCHHKDAMPIIEHYLETIDSEWYRPLLYIWGHAHELRCEADWSYMEKLVASVAGNDKIWYATNIELYDYTAAQRNLRISADESIIFNPSNLAVWVERDKKDVLKIEPGQTLYL